MSKTEAKIDCAARGYCRIPALELRCIERGKLLTPQEVLENEREKIRQMEARAGR